jgi:hypothetical protein
MRMLVLFTAKKVGTKERETVIWRASKDAAHVSVE